MALVYAVVTATLLAVQNGGDLKPAARTFDIEARVLVVPRATGREMDKHPDGESRPGPDPAPTPSSREAHPVAHDPDEPVARSTRPTVVLAREREPITVAGRRTTVAELARTHAADPLTSSFLGTPGGQPATLLIGEPIEYLEREPDGCYALREDGFEGLRLDITPRMGNEPGTIRVTDLGLVRSELVRREPVEGTDLPVGKPVTREIASNSAFDILPGRTAVVCVPAIVHGDERDIIVLLRVTEHKPQPSNTPPASESRTDQAPAVGARRGYAAAPVCPGP